MAVCILIGGMRIDMGNAVDAERYWYDVIKQHALTLHYWHACPCITLRYIALQSQSKQTHTAGHTI